MLGLNDLKGFFQPKEFDDSVVKKNSTSITVNVLNYLLVLMWHMTHSQK